MTAPISAYRQRAGNAPRPAGYVELDALAHTPDDAAAWASGEHPLAASPRIWWADISEYQSVVTAKYPYQQLAIRLDTGWRLDNNARANHTAWGKLNRSGFLMGYVVFIPGESNAILSRIRNAFGAQLEGIAPMVDMESGAGFAGPGNHSSEANDFVASLASTTGDRDRELGYANTPDWSGCWRTPPAWMKQIIANYSSTIVQGYWAQQYHGGGNYPVPAGWPKSCAPWGSYIDLNSAALTTPDAVTALGLGDDMPLNADDKNAIRTIVRAEVAAKVNSVLRGTDKKPHNVNTLIWNNVGYVRDQVMAEVAAVKAELDQVKEQLASLVTNGADVDALAKAIAAHLQLSAK